MKIIYNNIIPFKGFSAINLFGVVFVRGNNISQRTIQHEQIHTLQMKEMLYIFFYIWYVIEWICKLFVYNNFKEAYRNISFEREAYTYQENVSYICDKDVRPKYNWINFLKKKKLY